MYYDRLWRKWRRCTLEYLLAENDAELDICTVDENGTAGEPIKWAEWLKQNSASVQPLSAKYQPKRPVLLEPKEGDDSMAAAVQLLRMIWHDQQETNKLARAFYTICLIASIASAASYIMTSLFGS